jgi:hypothetical protein
MGIGKTGALLVLMAFLAACGSVRPVAKIGLIAPFEGLYRRSGYEALAAMRVALAEVDLGEMGVIPQALDDGADPRQAERAMGKLLADPAVEAVVGPLAPETAQAVAHVMAPAAATWFLPFAAEPDGGFAALAAVDWSVQLVAAVAAAAPAQGGERLVLAGRTPGWPAFSAERWAEVAGLPVLVSDDPAAVTARDAVFWLGSPDAAAAYVQALFAVHPEIPFWMGPQGGDPVFLERSRIGRPVYWATWLDAGYPAWAEAHPDLATPSAYQVYRATLAAIARVTGRDVFSPLPWQVSLFQLDPDGSLHP